MKLNLREIIEIPGGSVQFAQELDTALLDFPSVRAYTAPITAEGKVVNTAGILTLQGKLHAQMLCVCDRCGEVFDKPFHLDCEYLLATELEDEENDEILLLEDGTVDLGELSREVFILNMPTKLLCREDCRGLCPGCGVNLNYEVCRCKKEVDPRLAKLAQLLEKSENK